jgi:hypothetical protein
MGEYEIRWQYDWVVIYLPFCFYTTLLSDVPGRFRPDYYSPQVLKSLQ